MGDETGVSAKRGGFRLRIRGPRDFYGGLVLIALALIALWASGNLQGSTGAAFGPGTAPRMFATLLLVIGGVVAVVGLLVDGPPIEAFAFRGPAYVILAIVVFALTIRGSGLGMIGLPFNIPALGLIPSTFLAFMISIMGSSERRWGESLLAAVAMTAFCVGLFVYLLQLPFPLWPWS